MKTFLTFLLCFLFIQQMTIAQCNQNVNTAHYWGSNDGSEADDLLLGLRKLGNGNNAVCLESFKFITRYDYNNGTTYFKNRTHAWGTWHSWVKGSAGGDLEIARLGGSLTQNLFVMSDATSNLQKIKFNTNGVSFINGGKLGLGTTSPDGALHIDVDASANDASASGSGGFIVTGSPTGSNIAIDNNEIMARNNGQPSILSLQADGGSIIIHNGLNTPEQEKVIIQEDGKVGIGTNTVPGDYALAVAGNIIGEEVTVKHSGNWPDHVFENDYPLMPLDELEKYIQENGHLPGIPSAAEVDEAGGIEVGDMQKKLLEKMEEMTLYILQLEKRIAELEQPK